VKPRIVEVCEGSLTDGDSLLLVNASNTNCNLGTGVSAAIRQACGKGYQKYIHHALEEKHKGPMEPGTTLITHAGEHPRAKYVAHVAVMDYRDGFTGSSYPTLELIEECYTRLWHEIEHLDEKALSLAVVALGAGTGNIGLRQSVELACRTLQKHFGGVSKSRIDTLTFYGFQLFEYLAVLDVVRGFFEVDLSDVSEEVKAFLANGSGSFALPER